MKNYIIVNEISNQPILAIGFCSSYTDKQEAEKAAETWNKNRYESTCKVKVKEIEQN